MPHKKNKQTILVVDDTTENIDILKGILSNHYRVKAATTGQKALEIAFSSPPDLILLDIVMPDINGYEVCLQLKKNPSTQKIPVIFVTALDDNEDEKRGFDLGAVDYITKPVSVPIVKSRVRTHLDLFDQNRALEIKVRQRTEELRQNRLNIIRQLGHAAEFKDNETGLHVIRMSHYSKILAKAIGMTDTEVEMVLHAAPMHDVGKIGIPDKILLKPGKLDKDEWAIMQKHPEFGVQILGKHDDALLQMASTIAYTHHEKWNGKGYPQGLKGEETPLSGAYCGNSGCI